MKNNHLPADPLPDSERRLNSPAAAGAATRPARAWQPLGRWIPGTGLAAMIAMAATSISTLHGGPQLLYALLLGVAFHYLSQEPRTKPGIEFASRTILRLGVGLLGARITVEQIGSLGWGTALIVVAAVVTTILLGLWLGRRFGLNRAQGVLSGGSVAICGVSAALAISAALPREKDGDRFTLMVTVTVTVLSTIAMVVYPLLVRALDLPPALGGLFLGGTIHDVAQVAGAGYMLGHETGDVAIVVKLFRVSMLALVVLIVSTAFRNAHQASAGGRTPTRQPLLPWFLWMFIAMVVLASLGAFPPLATDLLNSASRACLVIAIAALGMKTSFAQLARTGWRPFALMLIETLWIAGFVLLLILVSR